MDRVVVVERADELDDVVRAVEACDELPIDVESNGLHAYRPALCTLQIACVRAGVVDTIFVLDGLALGRHALARLAPVLSSSGPPKIVHDLAFDARILAREGLVLGSVLDTAIAARFLGAAATGLSSLVEGRLGVKLSKELQHHDWGRRPIDPAVLPYLAADVAHLPALARALFDEATARDVVPEIEAETSYRLECAIAACEDDDPRPPWARIKGAGALEPVALAVLRAVAEVREDAARRWDVPPFKVVGNEVLLELARSRPTDAGKLRATRGLDRGRAASLVQPLRRAIDEAIRAGDVPADERAAWLASGPRPPRAELEARRAREQRLSAWRRRVAKERGVDEQVVLPGHCLQDVVDRMPQDLDALAAVPGIGARRVARDGEAILSALRADSA